MKLIKTDTPFPFSHFPRILGHCVLSGKTQRRDLLQHPSEKNENINKKKYLISSSEDRTHNPVTFTIQPLCPRMAWSFIKNQFTDLETFYKKYLYIYKTSSISSKNKCESRLLSSVRELFCEFRLSFIKSVLKTYESALRRKSIIIFVDN